jgi:S-layer protein
MIFTGSGKDSVTLTGDPSVTSTTKVTTVALGQGDDKLLNSTVSATTFTGATFDGGEGNDTVAASLLTVGNASKFTNFETLGLDKGNGTSTDISVLSGITGLSLLSATSGATATYTSVTPAKALTVGATTGGGTTVIDFGSTVSGSSDAYTVTFAATGATTVAGRSAVNAGTLSIEGIEAVTLVSGGSGYTANSVVLKNANARTLTISGDQSTTVDFNTAFGADNVASTSSSGVSLIDASALTGSLTLNVANVKNAYAGITVKGGSNADNITLTTETGSGTAGYTVIAGDGNDTITTANEASTLTGGLGNDTFDVTATKSGVASASGADSALRITTITDFASGDTIKMGNTTVATSGKASVTTATSLTNAVDLALVGVAQNAAAWFVYGSDTYVVVEGDAQDGLSANDMIVKLTGVTSDLAWTSTASGLIGAA